MFDLLVYMDRGIDSVTLKSNEMVSKKMGYSRKNITLGLTSSDARSQ